VLAALSYVVLERALIRAEGEQSRMDAVVGSKWKEWTSLIGYAAAAPLAFVSPFIAVAIYIAVSAMWLVPDRRFERSANLQA